MGASGKEIDIKELAGELGEDLTVMLILGDENPEYTIKDWIGDIPGITILLHELNKLIEL